MPFITKLDFSDNRQVKQHPETITTLSGATSFGVPFNTLPNGPNLLTSGITASYTLIASTFSGNSGTTNYTWYDSRMSLGVSNLSALTPSNSATTQHTNSIFTANTSTIIDGNIVNLSYSGVNFDIEVIAMIDLGGGNYSGTVSTNILNIISASTLDFTGRTIWVDVTGITRTNELIITKNPVNGYVLTCIDSEGKSSWMPSSGSSSSYWSASSGTNAIVVNNSDSVASGINSLAEGYQTTASGISSHAEGYLTIAIGFGSHAEGTNTTASGAWSHAEGTTTIASGIESHAEGYNTIASGDNTHAEGSGTIASGDNSHSEGFNTTASGLNSHAGGSGTTASGQTSFIHSTNSIVIGNRSAVIGGSNITGTTDDYVYVPSLNIKTIGSSPFINDIRIDATGNLTTNTSDIRFKENINNLENSLDKILKLQGVSYQWKDKIAGGENIKLGFIAQDVELIEPLLVFTNKEDGYKGIHIDGIIPLLVESVKELSKDFIKLAIILSASTNNTYLETQTILAEDNNIDLNYSGNQATGIGGGMTVLHAMGQDKGAQIITDEDGNWVTNNDFKSKALTIPNFTPTSSNDVAGNIGNITRDENYLYLKTANGWRRSSLESF